MNTPAHILLGAAVWGRSGHRATCMAAVLGAVAPDLSLYLMAGVSLFILNIPPARVFDQLYFSDAWQTVFAIDNSLFLWGGLLGLALWRAWPLGVAFAGAGLLHLITDAVLHAGDGRPHFWPLSRWVFDSPVSYWDSAHHAHWVAPLTLLISAASCVVLWRAPLPLRDRLGFAALLAAEIWVARQWILFF